MIFKKKDIVEAKKYYIKNGFVGVENFFSQKFNNELKYILDNELSHLSMSESSDQETNDFIYLSEIFMKLFNSKKLNSLASYFLESDNIELQHSKLNIKKKEGEGKVTAHQDWPFFPHINFDLIAIGLYLDGSNINNGGIEYYPKTHKKILNHYKKNTFNYKCEIPNDSKPVMVDAKPGTIIIHHCLTLHQSRATKKDKKRRALIFQYRDIKNKQIGGTIWKCTGLRSKESKRGNFIKINNKVERVRNLYDPFQHYKPDY
jgi:ectoine hydroxylase-related dioxygenase (phytanoyl-CoA dioxygenase family)